MSDDNSFTSFVFGFAIGLILMSLAVVAFVPGTFGYAYVAQTSNGYCVAIGTNAVDRCISRKLTLEEATRRAEAINLAMGEAWRRGE